MTTGKEDLILSGKWRSEKAIVASIGVMVAMKARAGLTQYQTDIC